ncbi:hypothetical protein NQZ68_026424, partial [Dissostichus eleginoides]
QHDRALHKVMEAIRELTTIGTNLCGRMDQVAAHLTTLLLTANAQAPDPAPALQSS